MPVVFLVLNVAWWKILACAKVDTFATKTMFVSDLVKRERF